MTSIRPCVVGFGEVVWDELPHATLPGGAPANFVWHAQQLGAAGVLVSAVGDDQDGSDLLAWLERMGLDARAVERNVHPTGRVHVRVTSRGEPGYAIRENSAWDAIRWTDQLAELARRADCAYFGSLAQRSSTSRATLYQFLRTTRPDCVRLFDVNLREPLPTADVIVQSLKLTDVLKLNVDEWPFVARQVGLSSDWRKGCRALLQRSDIRLIALTRGAEGSVLLTADDTHELPGAPVEVADTVGAGDAFAATLAVGLLGETPLDEIQRAASTIAAYVCTQEGATPRLPMELSSMLSGLTGSVHLSRNRQRSLRAARRAELTDHNCDGEPAATV
ncbi:MAG: carbohydrate kinase [Tepidisphaeraceae bacterium]